VIEIGALAEKHDGERRSEDRDQMIEGRRAVRPQHLDAAIVKEIRDERRQRHDVDERRDRGAVPDRIPPRRDLGDDEGREQQRAAGEQHESEAQGVNLRAAAQQHRVEGVDDLGDEEPDVALVQLEMQQHVEVAARDHDRDTGERGENPDDLRQGRLFAVHDEHDRGDEQRAGRDDEKGVDRLSELQRIIGGVGIRADADRGRHRKQAGIGLDGLPVALEMRPCERKQQRRGAHPADP